MRSSAQIRPAFISSYTPVTAYLTYSTKPPQIGAYAESAAKARKPKTSPKVTLVSTDESVSIVSLEEAEKISKRRDLKLVKIVDLSLKTQRPVYKLMTSAEYLTEDLKRREEKKRTREEATIKGDKLLSISARISEHDLNSKIQNVVKWLKKSYEVRVVISADGEKSKQEGIAARIEQSTKEVGNVSQKRVRDNNLRFQILPASAANSSSSSSSNTSESEQNEKTMTMKSSQKQELLDVKKNTTANVDHGKPQSARAFHTERMQA